jgi:hypothetical protein
MKPFVAAGLALVVPVCLASPATPSEACLRIAADREAVEKARNDAVERNDNAWRAIVPFAILARKASSKADIEEADKQRVALRRKATAEGCDAR